MEDNKAKKVHETLKKAAEKSEVWSGLTITELVDTTEISRSAVRTALAMLEGAQKVKIRKVGMAKLYYAI